MNILVINSGSSSLKYQIINMPSETVVCEGLIERIGQELGNFVYKRPNEEKVQEEFYIEDHKAGLSKLVSCLLDEKIGVLKSKEDLGAVGHRVVHGGSVFSKTQVVTSQVKEEIKKLYSLAPLHNPANLLGIEVCEELFPNATSVVVFDTAFHQTMPAKAFKYALPKELIEQEKIRKYGFHGTSHKFVSEKAIAYLGKENSKIVTCHIGNGASVSAIQDGKCIDHSMGFSPTDGLAMGTRTGDLDPAVLIYMIDSLGYSIEKVSQVINKQSGMQGMTGYSDFRDLWGEAAKGNQDVQEALDLYAYRVKKHIGAYTAAMNGLDAIVFTAGAGENSIELRASIAKGLEYLGIEIDDEKNQVRPDTLTEINTESSQVKILIIPTNEELEIAKQAFELV